MLHIFKSGQAMIKDKGTMADLSKKIELFINEVEDSDIIALNRLVKNREVGVIIVDANQFDDIFNLIKEAGKIVSGNTTTEVEEEDDFNGIEVITDEDATQGYSF